MEIDRTRFKIMNACGHTGQKFNICVHKDKNNMLPLCVRKITKEGDMILSEQDNIAMQKGAILVGEGDKFVVYDNKRYNLGQEKSYLYVDAKGSWKVINRDQAVLPENYDELSSADQKKAKDMLINSDDKSGNLYMLSKDDAEWQCIKNCALIAKSRDARDSNGNLVIDGDKYRTGKAILYVKYDNEDSYRRVSRTELINKAYNYIFKEKSERGKDGLAQRALLLSRNMDNAEEKDIEDYLLLEAGKNPEKIINSYEDEDAQYKLLVLTAISRGIVTKDNKTGHYVYGASILGSSIDSAVAFLHDSNYAALLDNLKKETFNEYNPKTKRK